MESARQHLEGTLNRKKYHYYTEISASEASVDRPI